MDDIEERNLGRDEKAFYEAGGVRGTDMASKPKLDKYDRMVQRVRMKHGVYDSSPRIRAFHKEMTALLHRVAKRAECIGRKWNNKG